MKEKTNTTAPLEKRPFDLQEAVILLDVYLNTVRQGTSITEAAEKASARLRALAKRKDYVVSDSYRSAQGVINRLRSIAGLYEGKEAKGAPGTAIFSEAVSLYKNNPDRYESILQSEGYEAFMDEENREKNQPIEQGFFLWLKSTVPTSTAQKLQKSYGVINTLLIKAKAIPCSLLDVTSEDLVASVLRRTKRLFANKRLREIAEKMLEQYLLYLNETYNIGGKTVKVTIPTPKANTGGIVLDDAEKYLLSSGISGATVQELIEAVRPGAAVNPTRLELEKSMNIMSMPGGKYVHADAFVDLDEAEEIIGKILNTHFALFEGYSNNQLLFTAAVQDLSMFLNDNDCENIESVYDIARYLFEKRAVAGHPYKFSMPHIFETEPDYPLNLKGLMINHTRHNGGLLMADEAKEYLEKTMLSYGSIGQLLQISYADTFLIYNRDSYLLTEMLEIDNVWISGLHARLDDLFRQANVAYVIPRDIKASWFETLPVLPMNLNWTPLLLQDVMQKFPEVGFKPIKADLNQSFDTIAAAFVPVDSPLQTFPDVITLFMQDRHTLPVKMACEELRLELREAGMLEGSEMIYTLPKALNDYRFAWLDENKTVYVRGN